MVFVGGTQPRNGAKRQCTGRETFRPQGAPSWAGGWRKPPTACHGTVDDSVNYFTTHDTQAITIVITVVPADLAVA